MVLLRRRRIMAAKIEASPGLAETLAAADGAFNAYDTVIQQNIEQTQREGQAGMGMLSATPGMYTGTATFRTDIAWDGTATLPTWAEVLLPACGWVKTGDTFTPRSEVPGANVKTLTIGAYVDGLFKQLHGASGEFSIVLPTGRPAEIEWTFNGVWDRPTDVGLISPTYPTVKPIRYATAATKFSTRDLCLENLTFVSGNSVVAKECATKVGGVDYYLVANRQATATGNPEAQLVATAPRYSEHLDRTEALLQVQLNADASGSTIVIEAPAAQIQDIQEGDRNDLTIDDITWQCNRNGSTPDDELRIIFTPGS